MNSMIPLMGRQPQINDPLDTAVKGATLQDLIQQGQLRQEQADALRRKAALEEEMRRRMERTFKETEDLYWVREQARQEKAALDRATTDTANPAQYPPGSSQSPIAGAPAVDPGAFPVQEQSPTVTGPGAYRMGQIPPAPVLSVDPAQAAAVPALNAPPAQTVSKDYAKMLADPDFHNMLAGNAHTAGLTKFGEDATKHALELEKARGPKTTIDKLIEGLPPAMANSLRNRAALNESLGKPPDGFIWADPQGNTIALKDVQAFMLENKKAGATKMAVDVHAQDTAGVAAAKDYIKNVSDQRATLRYAPSTLDNIEKAKGLIAKSGGLVGSFGDTKKEWIKFFNNNLGTNIMPDEIKSQEQLNSRLFFQLMDNLKKMDAQPTERQQEALKTALGSVGNDPQALYGILNAYEDIIRQRVDLYNEDVTSATSRGIPFPYDPIIKIPPRSKQFKQGATQKEIPGWSAEDEKRLQELEQQQMERARGN